jgi:disulfide bond formation protein DsbB
MIFVNRGLAVITLSRSTPQRKAGCQRCRIIRFFMLTVLMMVVLGLLASDKLHVLQEVTTARVAMVIWIIGGVGFFVKLFIWLWQRKQDSSDPEQV